VPFHLMYLRSILILSSHLRLGGLLLSGFAIKTNFSSPHAYYVPSPSYLLGFITLTIFDEEYKS
jgi:hypothetical protein